MKSPFINVIDTGRKLELQTPKGGITVTFSGISSKTMDKRSFKNLTNFIHVQESLGKSKKEALQMLTEEAVLSKLWPAWNEKVVVPRMHDIVEIIGSTRFPGHCKVVDFKTKNIIVQFDSGARVRVDPAMLRIVKTN